MTRARFNVQEAAKWSFMLAGLIIWTAHFMGVYTLASIGDVWPGGAPRGFVGLGVGALTLVCIAGDGLVLWFARRESSPGLHDDDNPELARFCRGVAAGGALLSLIGVVWQSFPVLFGL